MFQYLLVLTVLPSLILAQCGPGAVYNNNKCYQYYRSPLDFSTAESICSVSGGHLVSVHNGIDNTYISTQASKYFDGASWLGAKTTAPDVTNPLNWYWTDGSNFDYQNYKPGQPSMQGSIACMQLQVATGKWSTTNCTSTLPFVCAYDATLNPTCPTPVIPSHCPSGYAWYKPTDSCYKNYVRFTNFNDARSTCQADGGELASIHNADENQFLVDFSKAGITNKDKNWNDGVWIGLYYTNQEWKWTDGTAVNYLNWGDGEPNEMQKEWWVVLVADPHEGKNSEETRWNNVAQLDERAFLCKQPALH